MAGRAQAGCECWCWLLGKQVNKQAHRPPLYVRSRFDREHGGGRVRLDGLERVKGGHPAGGLAVD
jgi:hypothetical protein